MAVKICCFRFVQEGLNNAWRHGEGRGQAVQLAVAAEVLTLCISDRGPGFAGLQEEAGLGLAGLRDRVESLGGQMEFANRGDGPGAELCMTLDLRGAV